MDLPNDGLLDQIITITIKKEYTNRGETHFPYDSFRYAVLLADVFVIQRYVTKDRKSLKREGYLTKICKAIKEHAKASGLLTVPYIDVIYYGTSSLREDTWLRMIER